MLNSRPACLTGQQQQQRSRFAQQASSSTALGRALPTRSPRAPASASRSLAGHQRTMAAAAATGGGIYELEALGPLASKLPMPPQAPLLGSEKGSFAEGTITKRLPAILASTLSDFEASMAQLFAADAEGAAQGRAAAAGIAGLREEILANAQPSDVPALPQGAVGPQGAHPALPAAIQSTNEALALWRSQVTAQGKQPTWLDLPWLLVECYMYVRIARAIQGQPKLAALRFDPFNAQKTAAWAKSAGAAADLAAEAQRVGQAVQQGSTAAQQDQSKLKDSLFSVLQYALWGNKTDLSLLVDASAINPTAMAAAVAAGNASNSGGAHPYVIVDEYEQVWSHLQAARSHAVAQGRPVRMDIVLDNSGLELYSDLVLADFLITSGLASEVVLHGKPYGWFVSDVVEADFKDMLACCGPSSPTPSTGLTGPGAWDAVRQLGARWQGHLQAGRWRYTDHVFWVTPAPFCWMQALAPGLHADLANSTLVVLKGDLNYRKLTHDCRWPATTPFATSLQGFAPAPLLALRTLKADVVAGLQAGQAESLGQVDKDWMVNGKFGMIQFHKA